MKKRVILGLLVISILLIGSVSFVSASLFGDIWNKITGKVTENTEMGEVEEEICGDSICQEGEVCDIDCCEAFCTLYCPDGAVQGSCGCECIESGPEPPIEECEEGEISYYECPDGKRIPECKCEDGGWACKISIEDDCESPEPEICAAEIKITFNKYSYEIGDNVKIIIETFDSQGDHLPYCEFHGQMYDNMWHSPDLQKTDNKGYFIHKGIAEKPAGGVTEVKFKVYTRETDDCKAVEDTEKVKFEPEECGIGGCEPEPECKDKIRKCGGDCPACPEDDEDKDIFYPCNGCELGDNCYSFGHRKNGNYCSDGNDEFINQLADNEKCENNFECKTNLCINGNCVSSNILNRFFEWFKKMFGGGDSPESGPEICSKILIEKDIEDYEHIKSEYGPDKNTQAPLYSDDCEKIGTIKCCVALYDKNEEAGVGLTCPYEDRQYVENLIRCGLRDMGLVSGEYNGEKIFETTSEPKMMIWTYENYILATGTGPDGDAPFPEPIADAYLDKYPSDLEEINIEDIPPPRIPNSIEICGEIEDNIKRADCYIDVAISKSDFEICENIVYDDEHRDKCYINIAEHLGDASICDNVADVDLQKKCYYWAAEQQGDIGVCEKIADDYLQSRCYGELAKEIGDVDLCEKIKDLYHRNKCYREVAIATNDASICELIIDDGVGQLNPKDECYAGTD